MSNYINNITLEYLLNPSLYEKITNSKNLKGENNNDNDIKFYRHRIIELTKKMCKNEFDNEILKNSFYNYINTIIYYLKSLDTKDIIQSEYSDFNFNGDLSSNLDISSSHDLDISYSSNLDITYTNINTKKSNKLDNFVIVSNSKKKEKILPQKKTINLQDEKLKKKGVNKKEEKKIST